jgi:N6-L-threonylcarbamoyladenine synthase
MKVNTEILKQEPLILAFDTSCDETSVAVLKGRKVLSNAIASQVEIHAEFGGVVPDVARREHEKNIEPMFNQALEKAKVKIENIEYVVATYGPGLAIDLEVGLKFAQDIAVKYGKPFVPINHMEGHLLSGLLLNSKGTGLVSDEDLTESFPALGLLISGKHTEIIYSEELGKYTKLGQTLDDAVGEAFDKVGRMLNFGYPGGPVVSEFAKKGNSGVMDFPIPMKSSGDLNFSYSGLKTAALYKTKELREGSIPEKEWVYDFCRGFVDAVLESLSIKLKSAIEQNPEIKSVFVGGGVFGSEEILRKVGTLVRSYGLNYVYPDLDYRGDNACMIGVAGYFRILGGDFLTQKNEILSVDRDPRLSIETS